MTCAPSVDSDQPGHLRLWSDCVDAHADQSLLWAYRSFCWFCHAVAHICTCPIAKKGKTVYALYDWELKMTTGYGIKWRRNSVTVSDSFRNTFQWSLANSNSKASLREPNLEPLGIQTCSKIVKKKINNQTKTFVETTLSMSKFDHL